MNTLINEDEEFLDQIPYKGGRVNTIIVNEELDEGGPGPDQ